MKRCNHCNAKMNDIIASSNVYEAYLCQQDMKAFDLRDDDGHAVGHQCNGVICASCWILELDQRSTKGGRRSRRQGAKIEAV